MHPNVENWIESTGSRWNSSGKYPRIHNSADVCESEQFTGIIIVMSMYNDIVWREKRKRRNVYCEFQNCSKLCEKIRARTLVVSWAWIREGMVTYKPNGEWDHIAEDMMINFIESGQHSVDPVFCTRIFAKQRRRNIVDVFRW